MLLVSKLSRGNLMAMSGKVGMGVSDLSTSGGPKVFRHVLCVYPYRRELNDVGFFPPLGLEFTATVIEPYAQTLDIVDLRKEAGRTKDFIGPETDMVCFSI